AYNAGRTIGATLASVTAQTYPHLDIIVVDDGSTDKTQDIVRHHMARDPRIRLLAQANRRVAAARNRGVAASSADLIGPIDADDLWRPEKIDRQLRALEAAPPTTGLVYTWSVTINARDEIIGFGTAATEEGDVSTALATANFMENGSCVLMRRQAFE